MGTGEGGVVGTDVGWAENVGSAEGGVVGVDVGRFVAVVGSRDGIDVGVDVGTFVGAENVGIDVGVDVGTFVGMPDGSGRAQRSALQSGRRC